MEQYERVITLNKDTGEVYSEQLILANDEVVGNKLITKNKEKKLNFLRENNEFEKHCSNLGGFIHMIYLKNDILFNNTNIDKNNITRIIYLATFMNYEDGLLVFDEQKREEGKYTNKQPLTRDDIQEILKLNDSTFKRFLKNVKDNNLLRVEKKKFYINTECFIKGEVDKLKKNQEYCRLYINTIRSLYNGCKPTQHKILANILQLIPYIHYNENIICHNPNCDILKEDIQYLTLNEICDMLGISENEGNRTTLAKQLYSFKLKFDEKEIPLLSYVVVNSCTNYFVVNPLVIYKGNSLMSIKRVAKSCFFNNQTHKITKKGKKLEVSKKEKNKITFNIDEFLNKPLLKVERDELAKNNGYKWTQFSAALKKEGFKIELDKVNKTTTITR